MSKIKEIFLELFSFVVAFALVELCLALGWWSFFLVFAPVVGGFAAWAVYCDRKNASQNESQMSSEAMSGQLVALGSNTWWHKIIKAESAWRMATADQKVTVAVIDCGFAFNHPDLRSNMVPLKHARVFRGGKGMAVTDAEALFHYATQHGTKVAGIIAAEPNNGIGIDGVSHNALILPLAIFDESETWADSIATAIYYVVSQKTAPQSPDCMKNIRVINISLGCKRTERLRDAVRYAYENGILIVCSAGDDATDSSYYPSFYPETLRVSALMEDSRFFGLVRKTRFDFRYSNYGATVDISAPGTKVSSLVGQHTAIDISGTSYSSAMVAGAAALLFSMDMNATPSRVATVLLHTAQRSVSEPTHNPEYGFGILNMEAAVKAMRDPSTQDWEPLWPRFSECEEALDFTTNL